MPRVDPWGGTADRIRFGVDMDVQRILESVGIPEFPYRELAAEARAQRAAAALQALRVRQRAALAAVTVSSDDEPSSQRGRFREDGVPYTVAVVSATPGVGRTFLTANLAHAVSAAARPCLAVDLDPSDALVPRQYGERGPASGVLEVALDPASLGADLPTLGGITFMRFGRAEGDALARAEAVMARDPGWLRAHLPMIAPGAEMVILDTPAGASPWVEQALGAADEVLVVLKACSETTAQLESADALLRDHAGRAGIDVGYALNAFDARRVEDRRLRAALAAVLGERLRAVVHADAAVQQHVGRRRIAAETSPHSQVVADVAAAAAQLIARADLALAACDGGEAR